MLSQLSLTLLVMYPSFENFATCHRSVGAHFPCEIHALSRLRFLVSPLPFVRQTYQLLTLQQLTEVCRDQFRHPRVQDVQG